MPTSVCMYIQKRLSFVKAIFLQPDSPTGFPYYSKSLYCLYNYRIFLIRCCWYYSFAARFCAATIRGWHLFLWKTQRHQQRLDKVRTSDTVTQYAQPISHAVSHRIESYNTNSSSASLVTIVSKCLHMYACAMYTSHSYYSRTALFCSALQIMQLLFEGGHYLSAVSIRRNTVFSCACREFCLYVLYSWTYYCAHLVIWHTKWYRMVFSLWMYLALCASALVSKEARPPRM